MVGPSIKDLLVRLTNKPAPGAPPAESKPKLSALKVAIVTAEAEVIAVQGLSQAIKDAAKTGLDSAVAALQVAEKDCKSPDTHASLDKKRANVVLKCDEWKKRALAKQERVKLDCLEAIEAIASAREDLDAQEENLRMSQGLHYAAWTTANNAIEVSFKAEVTALEEQMFALSPITLRGPVTEGLVCAADSPSALQAECSATELQNIRAQMIQLNQRLEQQQLLHVGLVKENNSRYEAAIAKWEFTARS